MGWDLFIDTTCCFSCRELAMFPWILIDIELALTNALIYHLLLHFPRHELLGVGLFLPF
jgi:hypothetical protein